MVSLVWNLQVKGIPDVDAVFDERANLSNLDLELVEVGHGVVMRSASTLDNTENIWAVVEEGKRYQLRVRRASGQPPFSWDYAIAWRFGSIVAPAPVPTLPVGYVIALFILLSASTASALRMRPKR